MYTSACPSRKVLLKTKARDPTEQAKIFFLTPFPVYNVFLGTRNYVLLVSVVTLKRKALQSPPPFFKEHNILAGQLRSLSIILYLPTLISALNLCNIHRAV